MKIKHIPVIEVDIEFNYRVSTKIPNDERESMIRHAAKCTEQNPWVKTLGVNIIEVEWVPHPFNSQYVVRICMSDKQSTENSRKLIAANVMFIIDQYLRISIPEIPDDENSINYFYVETIFHRVDAEDD